jgi:hypothetical protein
MAARAGARAEAAETEAAAMEEACLVAERAEAAAGAEGTGVDWGTKRTTLLPEWKLC